MVEFKRSKEDSAPRWAGGRNMKLEGSDHVPVFLSLKDQPPVKPHNVPSFAVRFLPQLHGRQQSIYTLLQRSDRSFSKVNTHLASDTILHVDSGQGSLDIRDTVVTSNSCELVSSPTESEGNGMGEAKLKVNGDDLQFEASVERQTPILKAQSVQRFKRNLVQKGKQTNLKAFFAHSLCQNAHSLLNISKSEESNEIINKTTSLGDDEAQENDSQENFDAVATTCTGTHFPEETSFNTKIFKIENLEGETVHAKWKRIGDLMARRIPVCRHGEPCVARKVKKSGPNYGRGFYVCARAAGPPSNPEARCDHFEWASGKWKK
ncbi:hypothetical protein KP509_1Z155800 [Ceratopteris richardii]|nr:hypothetical protein KP509_1Z155800 [Ceratopteris richardii]